MSGDGWEGPWAKPLISIPFAAIRGIADTVSPDNVIPDIPFDVFEFDVVKGGDLRTQVRQDQFDQVAQAFRESGGDVNK